MSTLDPFVKRLVDMVRQMPDEALLELIKNRLAMDVDADVPGHGAETPPAGEKRLNGAPRRKKKQKNR